MDPFESLVSEFAGKAGLALQSGKDGSVDLVVDGVDVSVQYRNKRVRPFCICFTVYAWMNVTGLRGTLRGGLRGSLRTLSYRRIYINPVVGQKQK